MSCTSHIPLSFILKKISGCLNHYNAVLSFKMAANIFIRFLPSESSLILYRKSMKKRYGLRMMHCVMRITHFVPEAMLNLLKRMPNSLKKRDSLPKRMLSLPV